MSPVTVAARVCCWQEHLAFAPFSLSPSTQAAGSILVLYEPPYLALVKSRNLNLPLYLSFPLFACSRSSLPSLRLPFARVRKYVSLSALHQYLVPAHVFCLYIGTSRTLITVQWSASTTYSIINLNRLFI